MVQSGNTTDNVMGQVQHRNAYAPAEHYLTIEGRPMESNKSLQDYNIEPYAILMLARKLINKNKF